MVPETPKQIPFEAPANSFELSRSFMLWKKWKAISIDTKFHIKALVASFIGFWSIYGSSILIEEREYKNKAKAEIPLEILEFKDEYF